MSRRLLHSRGSRSPLFSSLPGIPSVILYASLMCVCGGRPANPNAATVASWQAAIDSQKETIAKQQACIRALEGIVEEQKQKLADMTAQLAAKDAEIGE